MNEREIFIAALQLADAERPAYLEGACGGDAGVRQRVDALMRAFGEAGSFLQQPAAEPVATIDQPPIERQGALIGPYKLLEQIGEGGMGLVYMAEQQQPVRRLVALKLVKPGMDSRQVIARFEAERQALAMMDHPNIAKVLEAGTTEAARPYFVMELVRGIPINEFCEQKRLAVCERLELFIQVCQAVQHAHQKGIIHRDLKPTNVLVTLHDAVAVPKVIDFGIAKALGAQLTEHTLHTGFAQLVGTPLYMSPEQAEMNQLGVDTRSDVYSLGVLLYELLTGTTPFDKDRLKSASFDEMRRIIREEQPETVSTRLAKTRSAERGARSNESSTPRSEFRTPCFSELDWIAMKALEKDRSRRYESASAFAADIQRYLSGDPILAHPPTTMYRFQKFARKHKPAFVTAAAIALCLLLGTTVSAWQAVRATTAEAQAKASAQKADDKAKEATQERDEAQKQRDEVKDLADKLQATQAELKGTLYAAHVNLAQSAWDDGNIRRVTGFLNQHVPQPGQADLRGFEWHYLNRLIPRPLVSFEGPLALDNMTLSADRTRVMSFRRSTPTLRPVLADAVLNVWSLETGREILNANLKDTGRNVAFSPDGLRLATTRAGRNRDEQGNWTDYVFGELKLWDAQTANEIRSHKGAGEQVIFSPDSKLLAVTWEGNAVKVFDALNGEERLTLQGNIIGRPTIRGLRPAPHGIVFSPDGRRLAAASNSYDEATKEYPDGEVTIWDVQTGQELRTIKGFLDWNQPVSFSPDGKRLATAGGDVIKLWDAQSGDKLLELLMEDEDWISKMEFSSDGSRLVGLAHREAQEKWTDSIKLWDTHTGNVLLAIKDNNASATAERNSPTFTPDGKRLLTKERETSPFERNKSPKVWDAQTGKEVMTLADARGESLAISPDSKYAASYTRIWDLHTGGEVNTIQPTVQPFSRTLVFSADSKRLVIVGNAGGQVWDVEKKEDSRRTIALEGYSRPTTRATIGNSTLNVLGETLAAFSPDLRRVASASGKAVKIYDAKDGKLLHTLEGHENIVRYVTFSPDGKQLASCDGVRVRPFGREPPDGTKPPANAAKIWDVESGRPLQTFAFDNRVLLKVAFSPDGQRLAGAAEDLSVSIWNTQTGDVMLTIPRNDYLMNAPVAFSPDGKRLACGGKMFDAQTGDELFTFATFPRGVVFAFLHFSPDGKRLLSSTGGRLKMLDAGTGAELFTVGSAVLAPYTAFSPDGKRLVAGGTIHDVHTGQELISLDESRGGLGGGPVTFSPDGHRLGVVDSGKGQVAIYDATPLSEKP